jgi:hypothetical protein
MARASHVDDVDRSGDQVERCGNSDLSSFPMGRALHAQHVLMMARAWGSIPATTPLQTTNA